MLLLLAAAGLALCAPAIAQTVAPLPGIDLIDTSISHSVQTDSLDPVRALLEEAAHKALDMSFDHVLSLYEWHGRFDYGSAPFSVRPAGTESNWSSEYLVHFDGGTRLQQENSSLTTEATGVINAAESITSNGSLRPFMMLYGTSYVTASTPGALTSASLITKQVDGFGIAGLRSRLPSTDVDASLGAGIARQSQPSASSYGAIVRGDLNVPAERVGDGSLLLGNAAVDERFYPTRSQRFSNDKISLHSLALFGASPDDRSSTHEQLPDADYGHNDAELDLGLLRRDFFFDIDSSTAPAKQERTEYSMLLVDSLAYPLSDGLLGNLGIQFEPRSVTRRSDLSNTLLSASGSSALSTLLVPNNVASLRIAADGKMSLYHPTTFADGRSSDASFASRFGASAQMHYEERTESVLLLSSELSGFDAAAIRKLSQTLDEASYSSRTTQTNVTAFYRPSVNDTLTLDGNVRLLNYDTPSEDNHDDHDELLSGLRLAYERRYSNELSSLVELRASRTHLVYLASDRSAQNDVTRSIGLATEASFDNNSYYGTLRGEVFADYTVLDYLDSLPLLQSVGSYVLRGLSVYDTSAFSLGIHPFAATGPLRMEGTIDLRINERGSYQATAFTERRDTRTTELSGALLLSLGPSMGEAPWRAKAGVRGFFLSRSGESEISLTAEQTFGEVERQTRIGPFAELSLYRSSGRGPTLYGSVWYAVLSSQTFDIPTYSRTPQIESHLQIEWRF